MVLLLLASVSVSLVVAERVLRAENPYAGTYNATEEIPSGSCIEVNSSFFNETITQVNAILDYNETVNASHTIEVSVGNTTVHVSANASWFDPIHFVNWVNASFNKTVSAGNYTISWCNNASVPLYAVYLSNESFPYYEVYVETNQTNVSSELNTAPWITDFQVNTSGLSASVSYVFHDNESDEDQSIVYWYVDGVLQHIGPLFSSETVVTVHAVVVPFDGQVYGSNVSASIELEGVLPSIGTISCDDVRPHPEDKPSPAVFVVEVPVEHAELVSAGVRGYEMYCVSSGNNVRCERNMSYWEPPGKLNVTIWAENARGTARQGTEVCRAEEIQSMKKITNAIAFKGAGPGISNIRSEKRIYVRNTGNVPIDIMVHAFDALGVVYEEEVLEARFFKAGLDLEDAVRLQDDTTVDIDVRLNPGKDAEVGFWVWLSMPSGVRAQEYEAKQAWEVIGQ